MKLLAILMSVLSLSCSSVVTQESFLVHHEPTIPKVVNADGNGGGTGFFLKHNNRQWFVTNKHICDGVGKDGRLILQWRDGTRVNATIVEVNEQADLCLATSEYVAAYPLKLAKAYRLHQEVHTLGHPALYELVLSTGRIFDHSMIEMIVSVNEKCKKGEREEKINVWFFQLNACLKGFDALYVSNTTHGGNSGSPVLDNNGNVIGVIFAGNTKTFYGLAVPLEELKVMLDKYR